MYRYSCDLQDVEKKALTEIYNSQHHTSLDVAALSEQIDSAIGLSNADVTFPLIVSGQNQVKAFCLVHYSAQEKIRDSGQLHFSMFIAANESAVLRFLFDSVFVEVNRRALPLAEKTALYGPLHNSVLIKRGLRTFADEPFTYQMPDNDPACCENLLEAGAVKAKDLLEIIYEYHPDDSLLTQVDPRLLTRLEAVSFEFVQKEQITACQDEIAAVYNAAWKDNWGTSAASPNEIALAAGNVKNIMGMLARKDGRIIGFTMMQFIDDDSGKTGRAFLSGVLPEWRQRGLSVVLTSKLSAIAISQGIKNFSISWMLEDNKMIIRTMQKFTRHGKGRVRRYRIFSFA
ncbi:GNAT family N-acetyltransferase [Erwinia sp. CGal63]|uniref:GNAT family N-acetyltransferase n=1 Tax=Erwinia sp. CGal63 TaxID=2919889 RepID=UPI00300A811D